MDFIKIYKKFVYQAKSQSGGRYSKTYPIKDSFRDYITL